MNKPAPTDRSRPQNISASAVGSPTHYKSFAAAVRSSIRSPSRDWVSTIQAITSPTFKADASSPDKTKPKDTKLPVNKGEYGFKEQVDQVKKKMELEKGKTIEAYTSPRPSRGATQESTPDNKSTTSKSDTPKISTLSANPYLLYQFIADQAVAQSMPNLSDKVASLTKELEDSMKSIGEKEKEIEQLKISLRENLEKLQNQEKTQAQAKEKSSQVEKSLRETCESLTLNLSQREKEIASLKMTIEKLNEEHKRAMVQVKEGEEAKLNQWKDKAVKLEGRIKALESELVTHGRATEGLKEKEKEIIGLRRELEEQEKEIKRIKELNRSLEDQLKRSNASAEEAVRKSEEKLKLEISQLKELLVNLEGEVKHHKEIKAHFDQMSKDLSANKSYLHEKEAKIQSLEVEVKGLRNEQEKSRRYCEQIHEAKALVNGFNEKLGMSSQSELLAAIQLLIQEYSKSQTLHQEESLGRKKQQEQMVVGQEDDTVNEELCAKIKHFELERQDLMMRLQESQGLVKSSLMSIKAKDLQTQELEREKELLQQELRKCKAESISSMNELKDQNIILQKRLEESQEQSRKELDEIQEKMLNKDQHIEALISDVNQMKEFIVERHGESVFEEHKDEGSEVDVKEEIRVIEEIRELKEEMSKKRAVLPVEQLSRRKNTQDSDFSVALSESKKSQRNDKAKKEEHTIKTKPSKNLVTKAGKNGSHVDRGVLKIDLTRGKRTREEDPVYKQLEKMIKELNEKVINSEKKAKKMCEEKVLEAAKAQAEKEQSMLEEIAKLKEEKKELLRKIDDIQWDKAYEYTTKMKIEKEEEQKAAELAAKQKQAALDASKKKKKK